MEVNGEAMTYQLWYNDQQININDNKTMNETFAFNLENLEPFTDYIITVVACTSFCSESSDSLTLRTKIGEPGAMFQPKLKYLDADKVNVSWEAPTDLGGNLDYFQLKLITTKGFENLTVKVYRVNGRSRSCIIDSFRCEKDQIDFFIRSVNVEYPITTTHESTANRTVHCLAYHEPIEGEVPGLFYGEWSQSIPFYCQTSISASMIIGSGLMLFISILSVFMLHKFYRKYQMMKDIHIVWPKGLDPNSPQSSPSKTFDAVRDLDLLKDVGLTDIEEEDEITELEKFIPSAMADKVVTTLESVNESHRESTKSEIFLPFICNPKTNEIFYQLPKMNKSKEKGKSAPTSPLRATGYCEFTSDPNIDLSTGYMKMYAPERPRTESMSTSVEGYLDMSGKPAVSPIAKPRQNNYMMNEIKMFLQDSELNHNGYIGKRASIITDPIKKHPSCINSNGYVGLHK